MKKIPFSIEYRPQIESGEVKVCTRDGRSVKILDWNWTNKAPILAGVIGTSDFFTFRRNGSLFHDGNMSYEDLFILVKADEHELTEFEKALKHIVNGFGEEKMTDEGARNQAIRLLSIARREMGNSELIEHEKGFRAGKAEALKNMPRWKKCTLLCGIEEEADFLIKVSNDTYHLSNIVKYNDLYLRLSELKKLPKEESI